MPAPFQNKPPFSQLAILENNQREISDMRSALSSANTNKDFSKCIQNMAAYFYADDHDNFWTLHKDLKMQLVLAIGQSSSKDFSKKEQLLTLLNTALEKIQDDIKKQKS